ncbi:dephospho-CoA kinase, partial [Clostridium perfringens]
DVQRARVLARAGMSAAKFDAILARQMPDAQKRARADFVIPTGGGLDATRGAVRDVLACMRARAGG